MESEIEIKYKDAQKHIKLLETRLNDLNVQLASANSEKDKLHMTINKYKERIDTLLFNSKKMEKEYSDVLQSYNELQRRLEKPSTDSISYASSNFDDTPSLQDTVRSLESEISVYRRKEKEYAEKEKELNRKQAKTAYYQEELVKAQTQITMLESKIHLRTQEKLAFEEEILELRDRLASISQTSTVDNAKSLPKRRVSHRSAVLVTKGNEVVESFESVVEELYSRLGEAEEENREISQSLENTQDELMKKYQQIVDLQSQNAVIHDELKVYKSLCESQESAMIENKNQEIALKSELQKLADEFQVEHNKLLEANNTILKIRLENELLLSQARPQISEKDFSISEVPHVELSESLENDSLKIRNQSEHVRTTLLPSQSSARISALSAISSRDIQTLSEELSLQLSRYECLKIANAKLLYKLLSAIGRLQVCCRIRPRNEQELSTGAKVCLEVVDDTEIACFDRRTLSWKTFQFDKVWDEYCTQTDVFSDIEPLALSVVGNVLSLNDLKYTDGFNACIFAYGQTGSGKTFTMNGYGENFGISYRTLEKIFELLLFKKLQTKMNSLATPDKPVHNFRRMYTTDDVSNDANLPREISRSLSLPTNLNDCQFDYIVEVSMLEIYNETVKDLLIEPTMCSAPLEIRNDNEGNLNVPGLRKERVSSLDEVMDVFARGSKNRATSATQINEVSSRSHSILIVEVTTTAGGRTPSVGKLALVDLAGSERIDKSGVTGVLLKETQHINKSLSALGDVMEGLQKKSKHIPYRNSKLTYLLQEFLGGNSKTMMIATLCPTEITADETIFALQFAARARNIQLGPTKKNHNWKTLEEALKTTKLELRDERNRVAHLTQAVAELKRDLKRTQEKNSAQAEHKLKSLDESRKSAELQLEVLTRTNGDLLSRLQMEKEYLRQASSEIESLNASLKSCHEQLKQIAREKDKLHHVLEVRDQENISLQGIIQTLREKSSNEIIISDRSISTVARASSVKTPKLSKSIHSKPFSPSSYKIQSPPKTRHSAGDMTNFSGDILIEETRSKVDLESLCKPTFSSAQHHSPPKEITPSEVEISSSPPVPPPAGSYRKGTIKAMATSRSRDAMMKHQERMKKKREMVAMPPTPSKPGDDWK